MLKVLFISFEFSPVQTTGNFRVAKFVKYLNHFGIDPIVLCGEEQSILQYFKGGKINSILNDEIPEGISVNRVPFEKKYDPRSKYLQSFYYADPVSVYWKKNAKRKADEIFSLHKDIKAIFVTLPPFSVNEVAYELSIKYKLPLIVDLRDAWSEQGQFPYFSRIHYYLNRFFEKRILKHARVIITVTKGLEEIYSNSNPNITKDKFKVIYNSFDNHVLSLNDSYNAYPIKGRQKFIIGYIGAFYYDPALDVLRKLPWWKRKGVKKLFYFAANEEWIYRSPYFFFETLSEAFSRHPELRERLFFGHIGEMPEWVKKMAREFNLQNNIIDYGFIKSNELQNTVKDFGALLLTTEKLSNGKSFCLPSKTFDYIKYGKPILSFIKSGDLQDFLINTGIAYIIDSDASDKLTQFEKFLTDGVSLTPDVEFISTFSSRNQARILAEVIKASIR